MVAFPRRQYRRIIAAIGTTMSVAAIAAGCGSDSGTTDPSISSSAHTTSVEVTPLSDSWMQTHFADPVLESSADRIPFTQTSKNPKGELIPANSRLSDPVMWESVGCQALAFSADAGPTARTATQWPRGWSQTPKGAALAGWSIAILFEVMPDRGDFIASYMTGDTTGFTQRSETRDPRAGVRQQKWDDADRCFRSSPSRRTDLDISVQLSNNNRNAALRWFSPKYNVTWDFPLVWDTDSGDWKATADGFRQYWATVDNPTSRPITPEFSW